MGASFLIKKVLDEVGLKSERFDLQWASAAEAPRFVRLITDFTGEVRKLGPIGESEGLSKEELRQRLQVALELVEDRKVRMAFGNATKTMRKEGVFTQEHIDGLFADKMAKAIASGLEGAKIG